jgi:chromosome segregation ATPase
MAESDETPRQQDAPILKAIAELSRKFDNLSQKFDGLEKRFDGLEERFDGLEKRIDGLEKRFDGLEKSVSSQFETIREGIVHNSAKYDRLEGNFFAARSDISNLRADIKELTEEVRQSRKTLV